MKLSVKGMALAGAIVLGFWAMLGTGLVNLLWPGYGQDFLRLAASVYPGYHATASIGQVLVGTAYGLVDGGVGGALFAWIYNRFV
jgi:hypothetical protein